MTKSTTCHLEDLKPLHLKKLANHLRRSPSLLPSSPQWRHGQRIGALTLPPSLLKPSTLLLRFAMHLNFTKHNAMTPCEPHSALNPFLLRSIFLAIRAETTTHLQRLTALSTSGTTLPPRIGIFMRHLQSLNSLWMSTDAYRVTFQVMPHEARYEHIESGCEGCILAHIGGDGQILSDLRAALVGRKKKRRPAPGLLALVDEWIANSESEGEIIAMSDALGREIRKFRRELQLARRDAKRMDHVRKEDSDVYAVSRLEKNRKCGKMIVSQLDDTQSSGTIKTMMSDAQAEDNKALLDQDEEDDENDFDEEAFIEYYAQLPTEDHLSYVSQQDSIAQGLADRGSASYRNSIAYRDSVTYDYLTGTFLRRPQTQHIPCNYLFTCANNINDNNDIAPAFLAPMAADTASNYSLNEDPLPSQRNSIAFMHQELRKNAEEYARGYRALVEERDDNCPVPVDNTVVTGKGLGKKVVVSTDSIRGSVAASNSTRWTDFYD